jgi:molecular chaperone HscB
MQYYQALGLEPKLALDPSELQKRFYERSRQWHPDHFSRAGAAEQERALDMTTALNDAFRTLRNPVSRAEYFLHQKGIVLSKDVPAELLEEVFELNMALEELRGGDESAREQLEASRQKFAGMLLEVDGGLGELFQKYDAGAGEAALDQIRGSLNRRRYISNLLREVDKEMNVHLSN